VQTARAGQDSLETLLREEVEERPLVAYRLLELLACRGFRVRIERGPTFRVVAESETFSAEARAGRLGDAAVSVFLAVTERARPERRRRRPRAA
jgi:hypothetical protein